MYLIKKVSEISGVSVRTLHHYDKIGLLSPKKNKNGYRYYSEDDISFLQMILYYKYLGFSLGQIKELIRQEDEEILYHLRKQLTLMQNEKQRLLTLIDTLEKTIESKERRVTMSVKEKFKGFTYQDNEKYKQAAVDTYGKEVIEQDPACNGKSRNSLGIGCCRFERKAKEKNMEELDYLVVGAGLFGAVFAHEAASLGKKVLVIDKRDHVGGNVYSYEKNGIMVHHYGAHIFHTNNTTVWNYVNRFADFNRFTNSPVANYKGKLYSLPFNMYTFNTMWGVITPEEAEKKIEEERRAAGIGEPKNLEEQAISLVGREIYEKLIKGYTKKQWGRDCKDLPASIIRRLPVRFTYDNNYFNALYQGIPVEGYTAMVEKMLEGIPVELSVDFLENKEEWMRKAKKVIFTGAIDAYYDYCLGELEYRKVRFEVEELPIPNFQGNAAVNYTDEESPYTRIIEHKWFTFGKDREGKDLPTTIISKEYSAEWKRGEEPYYPVNDEKNQALFAEYQALAKKEEKLLFGGRLGEYKYYDMDAVIAAALQFSENTLR